jgi:hypothetical protein
LYDTPLTVTCAYRFAQAGFAAVAGRPTSLLAGQKGLYFILSKKGFTSCIIKAGESGSSLRLRSTKRTLK